MKEYQNIQKSKASASWINVVKIENIKSAEDSFANKMGSGLSVFLAMSCPAWANSFSPKVCLLEWLFFDCILKDKFISALQVDLPEFENFRKY